MKKHFILCIVLWGSISASAQNNVGINTTSPHVSAALDIQGDSKGLLIPRMSTAQRMGISNPAKSLTVFDSTLNNFYYYNGSAWSILNNVNDLPAGGTTGQVLAKVNAADYNTQWITPSGGSADNLGNHTATTTLNMNGNAISNATNITASGTATLGGNTYPTSTGTNGQMLTTNGAGALTWTTPGSGGGAVVQLNANKVNGTGESCPVATSTTPATIAFNNIITSPSNGNTWTSNNTFTVGSGQAGLYMIQVRVHTPDASPVTNTVGIQLTIQINNTSYGSVGNIYGPYPVQQTNTPAGTKGKGEIFTFVYLNANDNLKILGIGGNSSTAPQALSADAGSNIMIVKMN
ncbi:hypothetical protein [Edaphocola flava]|uniref:hypothetical protein n=1 Tax=Edaphocola flava TaxID=2499629 RepID=UPI00100B4B7F|nr:hypothetical protein [Edaphocola flava]